LSSPDLETIRVWASQVGIRWGLSGQQRGDDNIAVFEEASWRAGLDRLLMGYAVGVDESVDGVLPYIDIEGRGAAPLGGLCRFVEVVEKARLDFRKLHLVHEWAALLDSYLAILFNQDSESELTELRLFVADLVERVSPFHSVPVSFRVICDWFSHTAQESRSSSGFMRGQLTFCSMLPMRSIPFKAVCLLGINDSVFPRSDSYDTFDLIAAETRPGDRSPRSDDRYQFLEAILSARSTFYVSYIGQSIKTNETIPPSVVVAEFIELLEGWYGIKEHTVVHPLHPFSGKYFTAKPEQKLFSFNAHYCNVAVAMRQGIEAKKSWWQGSLEYEDQAERVVTIKNLLMFYANPQKYFIRNCLGINLAIDEVLPEDREIFELSGLTKYYFEQELFENLYTDGGEEFLDRKALLSKMQTGGQFPLGSAGELAFEKKVIEAEIFYEKVKGLGLGDRVENVEIDLSINSCRLVGNLSNIYEKGVLLIRFGKLRGKDVLNGWLHHLIINEISPHTSTWLAAVDKTLRFVGSAVTPDLKKIIQHFLDGSKSPSHLYVEPAFAYATQVAKPKAKKSPLDVAYDNLQQRLDKGYEPEWELLFSAGDVELDNFEEFEQLASDIMSGIMESDSA
jgi:exodeoxyribonuclease V gamma subunit